MNCWDLVGQVGSVIKKDNGFLINIAENRYKKVNKETKKDFTIWYSVFSTFEPSVSKGDRVMAKGTFEKSMTDIVPYILKVSYIAVINPKNRQQ